MVEGMKLSLYMCVLLLYLSICQDVGMPAEYVNKLARMFQDIKVSDDLNTDFKEKNKGSLTAGE